MNRAVLSGIILLIAVGCTSSKDLQSQTALSSLEGPAAPQQAADCILAQMAGVDPNNTIRREARGEAIRLWADAGTKGKVGVYDILITPISKGSRAELRAHGNVWGTHNQPDETETIIANCLSQA